MADDHGWSYIPFDGGYLGFEDDDYEDLGYEGHEPWCGPYCDGTHWTEGGTYPLPCGCSCHEICHNGDE